MMIAKNLLMIANNLLMNDRIKDLQININNMIDVFDHIPPFQKWKCAIPPNSLNFYLDNLTYESIYKRELTKILINLPNICISHISSKKLLNNISNDKNLIDLWRFRW